MAVESVLPPPPPPNMSYRIEKLNPLAFPKGMDLRCELTGKPALVTQPGPNARTRCSATLSPCGPHTAPEARPLAQGHSLGPSGGPMLYGG